jgi:hypothetical protein
MHGRKDSSRKRNHNPNPSYYPYSGENVTVSYRSGFHTSREMKGSFKINQTSNSSKVERPKSNSHKKITRNSKGRASNMDNRKKDSLRQSRSRNRSLKDKQNEASPNSGVYDNMNSNQLYSSSNKFVSMKSTTEKAY